MNEVVNPEMLALARESRGMTQKDLAERLTVAQSHVSKYENGLLTIPHPELIKLARVLDYPEAFFYQTDPVFGYGSSCLYHRKRQSIPLMDLRTILAQINVIRIQISKLLKGAEIRSENKFPRMDIGDYEGSPEQVAKLVRASWYLPPGPIQNLIGSIENAGGIVVKCKFSTRKLDAVSQWLPGLPPLFFVNASSSPDRVRFTLAHEVGHLVMHRVPTIDLESEADRFAAEFLMPASDIRPYLSQLSLAKLASLKPYWKVSMQAILRRAFDLKKISEAKYRNANIQISKYLYRTKEPVQIPAEDPTLLDSIFSAYTKEHGYTYADLQKLMRTNADQFRELYFHNFGTELKVVAFAS
jgi:Zn-dependent peptidase ImmA (M78 family)/transcriptional regulator with XRE-family HTH domain